MRHTVIGWMLLIAMNATETRVIDSNTAIMRERLVVASLLDAPDAKPGPSIATALAHAPMWWDDPPSGRLAEAIRKCGGRAHTVPLVAEYLSKEDQKWLAHPMFNTSAVSMELAEYEAVDLVIRYRGKRLARAIGDAYSDIKNHPEKAQQLARALINTLREFV